MVPWWERGSVFPCGCPLADIFLAPLGCISGASGDRHSPMPSVLYRFYDREQFPKCQ